MWRILRIVGLGALPWYFPLSGCMGMPSAQTDPVIRTIFLTILGDFNSLLLSISTFAKRWLQVHPASSWYDAS